MSWRTFGQILALIIAYWAISEGFLVYNEGRSDARLQAQAARVQAQSQQQAEREVRAAEALAQAELNAQQAASK